MRDVPTAALDATAMVFTRALANEDYASCSTKIDLASLDLDLVPGSVRTESSVAPQ